MAPAAPHDGTPLLQQPSSGHVSASPNTRPSAPPRSVSSSSSSLTVRASPASQRQTADPALLRAPQAQEAPGHTPPPAYASLGATAPPSPWAYSGPPHEDSHSSAVPAFDLYASPVPSAHQFGPTPLRRAETVPYAAYIEAPGAPDARALRRFVGALGLALALCFVFSVGITLEVVGERGWVNREIEVG